MAHTSSSRTSRRTLLCRSGIAAALLAGALSLPMLGGCGATTESTANASASATSGATASSQTSATPSASSTSSSDGEVSASPVASGSAKADRSSSSRDGSAASDSSAADVSFSYSDYLDENGSWKGINALDYVTLPEDYREIAVPQSSVMPTDDAIQQEIDTIVSSYGVTDKVTDRAVADGDTVNIDYVGKIDGREFDGGSTGGNGTTVTIGATQYIDDFLEQLVGHKPGETFDVNVTFPETYGVDELNGKDATFTVTINYISETSLPTVNDDWVSSAMGATYGWHTVDEMRTGIANLLLQQNLASYVQGYVINNAQVSEVPQAMIDAQEAFLVGHYRGMASAYGLDFDSMLQMVGATDEDDLVEKNRSTIESLAWQYLVFQAVDEDAGIAVSDDEAKQFLSSQLGVSGDENIQAYLDQYGMPFLKMNALMQKTTDTLVNSAWIAKDDGETGGASLSADTDGSSNASSEKAVAGVSASDAKDSSASGDVRVKMTSTNGGGFAGASSSSSDNADGSATSDKAASTR